MTSNIEIKLALCYKVPRTTSFINKDILIFKKINSSFQKLDRTNNDIYILEIFNLLKILDNIFDMHKLYLILCEYIDIDYHNTLAFLINEIEKDKTD
ncbi:MAG: hypothetical protein CO117_07955, partial [Flavobacteriaceae bacterium CG_4_9_14_3_um_filter_33_16]